MSLARSRVATLLTQTPVFEGMYAVIEWVDWRVSPEILRDRQIGHRSKLYLGQHLIEQRGARRSPLPPSNGHP